MHGHRKLAAALAALLGGEVAGQDAIQFLWDQLAAATGWFDPMPDKAAASLFALLAAAVWYRTREQATPAPELVLAPAWPGDPRVKPGDDAGARRGAGSVEPTQPWPRRREWEPPPPPADLGEPKPSNG